METNKNTTNTLSFDENDPFKGWTSKDVDEMTEKQLREFCKETLLNQFQKISIPKELKKSLWKKLLSSKTSPSNIGDEIIQSKSKESKLNLTREQFIKDLISNDLTEKQYVYDDKIIDQAFTLIHYHHYYLQELTTNNNNDKKTSSPIDLLSSNTLFTSNQNSAYTELLDYHSGMTKIFYYFLKAFQTEKDETILLSDVYKILFVFLNEYIKPLNSKINNNNVILNNDNVGRENELIDCFDQMFRLLLQYHDPELQVHFDSHRIEKMIDQIVPWFKSLLFDLILKDDLENINYLLNLLIIERDPVILCFMVFIILIRNRKEILLKTSTKDVEYYCSHSLNVLSTKEDIFSIYLEAIQLKKQTPISSRNQLLSIFQPNSETDFTKLKQLLQESVVLPLPTSELVNSFHKNKERNRSSIIKYIIIDCRSNKSFQYARLPTAVHIGTKVGYDNKKMKDILSRFEDAKGSHFIVFGTGRKLNDEENLLKLIAMKFVANHFPHISLATDGFKGCIKFISSNQIEFVRDESQSKQSQQNQEEEWTSKVSNLLTWGKKIAEDYIKESKVVATNTATIGLTGAKQTLSKIAKPVFALGDDSDTEEEETHQQVQNTSTEDEKVIKLDDLNKISENITIFNSHLRRTKEHRYIVIGDNLIMSIKAHPQRLGYGIIQWKRTLRQIVKLSFKKSDKTAITFTLKGLVDQLNYNPSPTVNQQEEPSFQEQYTMDEAEKCVQTIQTNVKKLKKE
ncbi:hypothetical protein ABK040_005963 [Willaertia magna]